MSNKHILLITAVLSIMLFAACKGKRENQAKADADVYYTCSMDPQVVEAKPGKCPICHMELTAVHKSSQQNDNELQLSPEQIKLGNIHVDTIKNGNINNNMLLTATLGIDQQKVNAVSAKVAGRIERLYFKNVGDYINKGAKLFDLYSEELNNAKQEYKLALQKQKVLGNTVIDYNQLIESAKNKLLLWGMSEAQIKLLAGEENSSSITSFYSNASGFITSLDIKEGDYVAEGQTIVQLADLTNLWAEAQVYTSQLSQLRHDAKASVQVSDRPGKQYEGSIEFVNPEINPATRINLIRINIPNSDGLLKPGMPAYVTIKNDERKTLSLPAEAVLRDGKMAMIWLQTAPNKFVSKMVETGVEGDGFIEITAGINEGDAVVTNGAYLLQSEYIFRKGSSPMAGHDMDGMKM